MDIVDTLTPQGCYRARDWRGAERSRHLAICGGSASAGGHVPGRNPRKARFPAQPEMRPNNYFKKTHSMSVCCPI
jgi:hypothetical protein